MTTPYDYVIAIDYGTTMTAWAIRKHGEKQVLAYSPISTEKVGQKTPSDMHAFLTQKGEAISMANSQIGNTILRKFEDQKYKLHYHFAYYKMSLYKYQPATKQFCQKTQYPDLPLVSPQNSNESFKLSDIYIVITQHIKASIEKYFANNGLTLNIDRIVWAITVPAIAQQEHKYFMIQCFKTGMGQVGAQKKEVADNHIEIVLEPEGGFLYALNTKEDTLLNHNTNMAIFDFGGGTYDMTVAKFTKDAAPEIVISDFGEDIGGSDVDKAFMRDFENITQFSKVNIPEKEKSIILFNILAKFQNEKHEHWGKADQDSEEVESFNIIIAPIWANLNQNVKNQFIADIQKRLEKENDPEDPDIILDGDELIFKVDYAKQKYLFPTKAKLVAKTIQLIKLAKTKNCDIDRGLMLGGFSACKPLLDEMKAQFALPVLTFDDPSLAIVKGATFFDRYNITKKVKRSVGLEVAAPIENYKERQNQISFTIIPLKKSQNKQKQNIQLDKIWDKFVDNRNNVCAASILTLFEAGDIVTDKMFVEHEFQCSSDDHISVVVHLFENDIPAPMIYAHDTAFKTLNTVQVQSSMGFKIRIPEDKRNNKSIFTMKFVYCKSGQNIVVYHKWGRINDNTQYDTEIAMKQDAEIEDLNQRFKKETSSPVHAIFVVDKSGSMDCSTVIPDNQRHPRNTLKNSVGDIFQNGIFTYIQNRITMLGNIQMQDKYTIVLFDTTTQTVCQQMSINDPQKVFDFEKQIKDYGGTDFGPAMQQAVNEAKQCYDQKLSPQLLFLTDGEGSHPDDQINQQAKGVFKKNTYFLNAGEGAGAVDKLAVKFGTHAIPNITDAQAITDAFAKLSIPELLQ